MKSAALALVVAWSGVLGLAAADQPSDRGFTMLGVFTATIPCADCSSHKIELTLYGVSPTDASEGKYELRETFQFVMSGSGERLPDRQTGRDGKWVEIKGTDSDPLAIVVRLDPEGPARTWNFLRIGEHELREFDGARREIRLDTVLSLRRVPKPTPGQLPGYRAAAIDAADVKGAADFSARAQALRSGDAVSLTKIVSAQQQLVNTLHFKLCLEVMIQGRPARTTAIVYRDLNGYFALSQWIVGDCQ